MNTHSKQDIETTEIRLLLEGIYQIYGFDFRNYAEASLRRRINKCMMEEDVKTVSAFQDKIIHDPACMERFLLTISIDVSSMFRDPGFYQSFRTKIVPLLRSYPFIRVWHVGCAAGEEVYSMAILLEEEGLYAKSRLYATDMNEAVIAKARDGIFSAKLMQEYTDNYIRAGGQRSFSEYYTAKYENAIMRPSLQKNIVWAKHNLVTDHSFNEFHVIICRNVMIYFNRLLQARVHELIYESLATGGFLGLGKKESLKFAPYENCYEDVDEKEKLFKKVK